MKLGIQIDKKFQKYLRREWLHQVVEHSLVAHGIGSEVELGLLITDDETVRELNQEYRGVDEPTDVLSFALVERKPGSSPFITPPDDLLHLGEVIVSYPQAVRQAEENKHRVEEEVALLVVHGVLHLLGYEHDKPAREQEMRGLEKRVLSEVEKRLK
jgi:probable rRNA maturation factor